MAKFLRTATETAPAIGLTPKQKKKKRYADILRARFPKKGLRGGQTVPMDIAKINAAFDATRNPS